ncbi:MAG: sigma-70 family RNA polymerase sigma factor [Rhodospirillales bacterium]|jgi:RNA polymerase sigma-70 factor (ECF subfamily)|nr:sigma-70 family RNA polymerase sigma factor [Rhodospirillales bacterium]
MRAGPDQDREWGALMRQAQQGDGKAYARLLREISPLLRATALHKRCPPDLAEDVVQETLLSLHQARHTYDPGRDFLPWLMAIFRHRFLDRLRAEYRRGANEVTQDPQHETFLSHPANEQVEAREAAGELAAALAILSPGQRRALELMKLEGLSLKEASALTGAGIPTLKVTVHRAMTRLRQHFEGVKDNAKRPLRPRPSERERAPGEGQNKDKKP